jgi:hypothetical protein
MFFLLISTSTCVVKSDVKDTCSIFFCPTGVFMNLIQKVIIMGVPNEALRHNKVNEDTAGSLCYTQPKLLFLQCSLIGILTFQPLGTSH